MQIHRLKIKMNQKNDTNTKFDSNIQIIFNINIKVEKCLIW